MKTRDLLRAMLAVAFAFLALANIPAFAAGGTTTINGLPAATTPLTGTEVVPLWQNSATKNVPVANLTALYASPVPPASPFVYQLWINSTVSPYPISQWDGTQWVVIGSLDTTGHIFSIPSANLPAPTSGAGGVVKSSTAPTNNFATGVNTSGAVTYARPSATNVSGLAASATTDTTNAGNISSGTLPAARTPAYTGDVASPAGSTVNTIQPNAVTNADLATAAANTVKSNVTGSTAAPSDNALPSCNGATNAVGYQSGTGFTCNSAVNAATLGGKTFASPAAIGSTTPALVKSTQTYQSSINQFTNFASQTPTGTTSASAVMMGLGSTWSLTPSSSGNGNVSILVTGYVSTTAAGGVIGVNLRYGTGSAPANGAAATGTAPGTVQQLSSAIASARVAFVFYAEASLTPGTTYWFDPTLQMISGSGTASLVVTATKIADF